MDKLSVNNFAGLKSVRIDVRPVTGLIGPQSSGKSIIAKLLYFFREIGSGLTSGASEGLDGGRYKQECCKRFRRYFPTENTGASDFEITYTTKKQWISVNFERASNSKKAAFGLEWSGFFDSILEKIASRKSEFEGAVGDAEVDSPSAAKRDWRDEIDAEITDALGKRAQFEQMFIPAGRAFFSQVRGTIFSQIASGEELDPFMASFGRLLERSRSLLEACGFYGDGEQQSQIEDGRYRQLHADFNRILHANLLRIEKEDFLEFQDGRRVKLTQASSGQQEVLPLLLLLARFISLKRRRGRAVYIEEPEAHLFPSTQKLVVEMMAGSFRARDDEMNLVITTHSPYILTSVNNLLQAGQLYSKASPETSKKLGRIIDKRYIFKPGEVGFYALRNGRAYKIMDADTGLINAELIDSVSGDIAIEFDRLLAEGLEKS